MPMKATGPATDPRTIDRWDGGVGWIAHPEETMERASHALAVDGDVWVVDPVDAAGVDDLVAEFGTVAGAVVLLDRHTRDAAAVARRHDVAVHYPAWMGDLGLDAPTEPFEGDLADTGYRARRVVNNPLWREAALVGNGTLVVADAVGTASYFRVGDERLGVSPRFGRSRRGGCWATSRPSGSSWATARASSRTRPGRSATPSTAPAGACPGCTRGTSACSSPVSPRGDRGTPGRRGR